MKKHVLLTLMAAVMLMVLPSCGPDDDPLSHLTDGVKVTTTDPKYITGSTASCGAEVTADDSGLLIEIGVCWSLSEHPTIDDKVVKSHHCSQPFTGLLTHLEPNTEYYVCGYAQYGTEYVYGDVKSFTTLIDSVPAGSPVTTLPAYDITCEGFTCEVQIEPFGAAPLFTGVCYSRNPNFTINDCEGVIPAGFEDDDPFHAYCYCYYGLMPNTQYYYRAFVAYSTDGNAMNYDYFYGEILNFTTLDIPLDLSLYTYYPYYHWNDNYVELTGYMECNKPEIINEVGFCYSHTNEYPQFDSDFHIISGTPTGEWYDFSSDLYNLSASTRYYFRSYARYMTDSIRYGNVVSFDTN